MKRVKSKGKHIRRIRIQSPPSISTNCLICTRRMVNFNLDDIAYNDKGILSISSICPECKSISMYQWEVRNGNVNLSNRTKASM
jgi:hypothetical protein